MAEPGVNRDQVAYWSGPAGQNWVAAEEIYDGMHAGIAQRLVEHLAPVPGERVLDVGAGTGAVSLAVADLVRPGGHVTALDISPTMLGRAAERITEADRGAIVSVLQSDAQTHPFEPATFDAVTSRFGVMFFDDPVAAFANLGRAVRPDGRLSLAVWQAREHNEFLALPHEIIRRHREVPEAVGATTGDPFSLGDPAEVRRVLGDAGWTEIALEPDVGTMLSGGPATVDEAVAFVCSRGHVMAALSGATDDESAAIVADLQSELAARHDGEGVRLGYAAWIVTARRP